MIGLDGSQIIFSTRLAIRSYSLFAYRCPMRLEALHDTVANVMDQHESPWDDNSHRLVESSTFGSLYSSLRSMVLWYTPASSSFSQRAGGAISATLSPVKSRYHVELDF